MLHTTDAIVLSLQPHSDKAHLLHAYTRAGGRVNYRVYGLGKKHAIGMYSPLSLIQLTADASTIRTAQLAFISSSINSDPYKRTIAMFLSEVLYNIFRHPMPDEPMFEYIAQSIRQLEETDEPQNFHLAFLIGLAAQLGFAIPESETTLLRVPSTRSERQQQLRALCTFFEEHVETWQNPKSLDVLMEVFD